MWGWRRWAGWMGRGRRRVGGCDSAPAANWPSTVGRPVDEWGEQEGRRLGPCAPNFLMSFLFLLKFLRPSAFL